MRGHFLSFLCQEALSTDRQKISDIKDPVIKTLNFIEVPFNHHEFIALLE
jgi:hypothetical protein